MILADSVNNFVSDDFAWDIQRYSVTILANSTLKVALMT